MGADDSAGVRFPPPLIYIAGLVAGLLLDRWHPLLRLPLSVTFPAAVPVGLASLVVVLPAVRLMRRAGTAIDPRKTTTRLVVAGPFRFTRNPLYLSLVLLYAAIAVAASSLWMLLLLPAVVATVQAIVISREEAYLERKFGDDYRRYRERVRRWL